MAKLIGTAGHVDHGKTTLIKALTGIDADRLPEEKKRGMTIDIGFAYVDLPGVGRASIVDVPGHEKFLTNMLVGALGIDVALLCVSADESVMPQTREHLQILELLPVQKLVVAVTRADLADEETRAIALEEVGELVGASRFGNAPTVFVSAFTGEGLGELKSALAEALSGPAAPSEGPWYLPIDRVFAVKGHGAVVTGSLARGKVKTGDRAFLEPGHVEVRVRRIHSHEAELSESEKGRRTALNLGGVKLEDVHRGMAVGEPGALFASDVLDARVVWVRPPKHAERVRVSIGADEAIGRVFLSETTPEVAQLRLERPVACALDQPLIVRRYSPPDLLAGGRVAVPQAKVRRKSESASSPVSDAADLPEAILAALEAHPNGIQTDELARTLGKTPEALSPALAPLMAEAKVRGFSGLWFTAETFDAAASRFLGSLAALHEANPAQASVPRERVVERAKLPWAGKPLDRIVAHLVEAGAIRAAGTQVRAAGFKVQLSERQRALLDRVVEALDAGDVNAPGPTDIASSLRVPPQAVEEILRLGVQAGEVVRIGEGIHFTASKLQDLKTRTRSAFGSKPFSAGEFRDALGTTRKYAIPILEYFDQVRFTLRTGDNRVIRAEE